MSIFALQAQQKFTGENNKNTGICLTLGGVSFTTAAILENGAQYGTNIIGTATSTSTTYVTPPIWKQTPRNIMFVVGIGLTITGLLTIVSNK